MIEKTSGEELSELSAEKRKELSDRVKARTIVQEILNFGVNDSQIREIIRQLSLELEDRDVMLKIYEFLGSPEEGEQQVKVYT